jgi:hypothetical protein
VVSRAKDQIGVGRQGYSGKQRRKREEEYEKARRSKSQGRGLTKGEMTVILTLQLSGSRSYFFHLYDANQADGCDLAWLVELFWSALAPPGCVSAKMPAMSLQWKGRSMQESSTCRGILTVNSDKRGLLCPTHNGFEKVASWEIADGRRSKKNR